jgi:hypothetical protein
MQNASFGLVFAAATHANPRHAVKTQIEPKNISQYKKTAKKNEKCSNGPNDALFDRLGSFLPPPPTQTLVVLSKHK